MKYLTVLIDLLAAMGHDQVADIAESAKELSQMTTTERLSDNERIIAYSLTGLLRCYLRRDNAPR